MKDLTAFFEYNTQHKSIMMHDHQNSNAFFGGLHTNISITTEWDYETLTSFQGTAFQKDHIKITLKTMFQYSI